MVDRSTARADLSLATVRVAATAAAWLPFVLPSGCAGGRVSAGCP
jgi:hypothetical protein